MTKVIDSLRYELAHFAPRGVKISWAPTGCSLFVPLKQSEKVLGSLWSELTARTVQDVKISSDPKGCSVFIFWPHAEVTLSPEQLQAELKRVLEAAGSLTPGEWGKVELLPWISYIQCWYIIKQLKYTGFVVEPNGDRLPNGYIMFKINPNGSLTLRFRHYGSCCAHRESSAVPASTKPLAEISKAGGGDYSTFSLLAEKLTLDRGVSRRQPGGSSQGTPASPNNKSRVLELLRNLHIPQEPFSEIGPPESVPRRFMKRKAVPRRSPNNSEGRPTAKVRRNRDED